MYSQLYEIYIDIFLTPTTTFLLQVMYRLSVNKMFTIMLQMKFAQWQPIVSIGLKTSLSSDSRRLQELSYRKQIARQGINSNNVTLRSRLRVT